MDGLGGGLERRGEGLDRFPSQTALEHLHALVLKGGPHTPHGEAVMVVHPFLLPGGVGGGVVGDGPAAGAPPRAVIGV